MKKLFGRFKATFFNSGLDLRVRLFNVLAMAGSAVSFLSAIQSILVLSESPINALVNIILTILSVSLLWYSVKSRNYQLCYLITIIGIFILAFPFLFFASGAYHGAMPYFFTFAIVFTIFMLEGKKAIFIAILEALIYIGIFFYAYNFYDKNDYLVSELGYMIDVLYSFLTVSFALSVCLFLHFRLYNEQQKKLNEQNIILEQVSRAKSEFLSNSSHEMRTPLTVISVNVQTVIDILNDLSVKTPEADELLQNAQSEVMRLARMVGGMLALASISESTERKKLDLSTLLQNGAEMLRLNIQKGGNILETTIESGLKVFGSADLIVQVITNLLQNAGSHTKNGKISLNAVTSGKEITITVKDSGTGISETLLPHIFERGVSGSGGTGFGLYLCKLVVESHGGRIWAESQIDKGTILGFTIPSYEGQFGGNN